MRTNVVREKASTLSDEPPHDGATGCSDCRLAWEAAVALCPVWKALQLGDYQPEAGVVFVEAAKFGVPGIPRPRGEVVRESRYG